MRTFAAAALTAAALVFATAAPGYKSADGVTITLPTGWAVMDTNTSPNGSSLAIFMPSDPAKNTGKSMILAVDPLEGRSLKRYVAEKTFDAGKTVRNEAYLVCNGKQNGWLVVTEDKAQHQTMRGVFAVGAHRAASLMYSDKLGVTPDPQAMAALDSLCAP